MDCRPTGDTKSTVQMPKKAAAEKVPAGEAAPAAAGYEAEEMLVRELTAKRASVDHYRAECERLRKKNHQLIQQMVDKEKANFEVNDFWETQVGEKDKMISQLKDQILKKEEEYEKEKNIAEEIFEAKIKWMESENDDIENKLSAENAKLTNELTNLKNFAEQKENLEQQLEQLAAEKKELEERQSETVVKMERKFIEEKARGALLKNHINAQADATAEARRPPSHYWRGRFGGRPLLIWTGFS